MRARLLQFVTGTSKVHFLQRFNMGDGYFCETCVHKNVLTGDQSFGYSLRCKCGLFKVFAKSM